MKIEHGIPVPDKYDRNGGAIASVIRAMKVGDSVVVETVSKRSSFGVVAKRLGAKVTSRDIGNGQIRIWLLEPARRQAGGGASSASCNSARNATRVS